MKNQTLAQLANQTIAQLANKIVAFRRAGNTLGAPSVALPSPIPHPLVYKSGGNTGAMIALFLPTSTGVRFIQSDPNALPPSELHITLAYLGKAADISPRQIMDTHDLMKLVSENHPPLTGHINGCGRFCNGDADGDPFFIIPDLPALPNLRQIIIDGLRSRNIEKDRNHGFEDHGFTPHITLTYLPHAEYNPFDIIEKTPVAFGAISLVMGDDRYDYPLAQGVPLLSKAALIEKIGARHTGAECGTIQKMHDLTLELGAECHPLTRRAGARHSHADQGLVQRMHDDCSDLGAVCKAMLEKDRVYSSQVLKERRADPELLERIQKQCGLSKNGEIIKAQSDAPNYKPASTPQRCANCRFFLGDPGRDWCDLFDFTADPDYVSDAWEPQRPDEIPGYVANKSDLAALTLRNWENSSPTQRKARDAINNAIKAGTLKKANTKQCFRCGKRPGVEYHHINGYSEGKKLNVRAVCYQCHSAITRKAEVTEFDLATLTEGILISRGASTSGNWGHVGRKGIRGGSGGGGGFGRIGVKPGAKLSRKKVQAAAKKQAKGKKPTAKPKKVQAKKLAAKPKVSTKKPAAKPKATPKSKDQDFNQKDAKKFGWLSEEMASFEKDNAGAKIESGAVYSKDGKELFRVKGDENAVDFNESQLRQMKGAVVTHNHPVVTGHPDGGSFSPSDIKLMFNTDAAEVRAVTENYIHVVKPKKFGGRTNKNALNFFDKRKKETQVRLTKQVKAGKLKRNDFAVEFWHQIWKTAADDGLLIYERIEK